MYIINSNTLPTDEGKLARNHGLGIIYYRETIYANTIGIVSPCLFIYKHVSILHKVHSFRPMIGRLTHRAVHGQ